MKCAGSRNDNLTAQHNTLFDSRSFIFFFNFSRASVACDAEIANINIRRLSTNTNSITFASKIRRGPAAPYYTVFRVLSTEIPFGRPLRAFDRRNCRYHFLFVFRFSSNQICLLCILFRFETFPVHAMDHEQMDTFV